MRHLLRHTLVRHTLVAALAAGGPVHADNATAAATPSCEEHAPRHDRRDIRCTLRAVSTPQRFHFQARFSGSHDDTTASLTATIDGQSLMCGPGSKTLVEGEDGEVTLDCRFSITPEMGAAPAVRMLLAWHHARYTDYALTPD